MKNLIIGILYLALTEKTYASNCGIKMTGLQIPPQQVEALFVSKGYYMTENENVARFSFENDCGFDGGRCINLSILDHRGVVLQDGLHVISYNSNEPWENLLDILLNKLEDCHH